MALAIDSQMASGVGAFSTNASSLSYSFTNTAGTLLVCGVQMGRIAGGGTVVLSSVTYNSVSMGSPDIQQAWDGGSSQVSQLHLLSPATGANTVLVTVGAAYNAVISGCISFTGNDSTTPVKQTAAATGNSAAPSVAVPSTTTGNIVVDCMGTGALETGTGQTISWVKNVDGNTAGDNAASSSANGNGGSVTMSYTVTTDLWGIVALEIAAGGAVTGTGLASRGRGPKFRRRARSTVAYQLSTGTTFPQSVGGTLTSSGALLKQAQVAKAGTLTSAGALINQTTHAFVGTLSSGGALLKQIGKALGGTMSGSGALAIIKVVLRSFGGTLSMSGALVKQVGKGTAGTLSGAGALVRQTQKGVAGALSSSGALLKRVGKALAGTLASSGTVSISKVVLRTFGGTLAIAGTLVRQPQKALAGTLSSSGSVVRQIGKRLAGTLATAGGLTKRIARTFTGTLSFLGSLIAAGRAPNLDNFQFLTLTQDARPAVLPQDPRVVVLAQDARAATLAQDPRTAVLAQDDRTISLQTRS